MRVPFEFCLRVAPRVNLKFYMRDAPAALSCVADLIDPCEGFH